MSTHRFSLPVAALGLLPAALVSFVSFTANAAPPFVADDTALDAQACGASGCWSNYMRADDLDGDGDLDLLFANYAGFFEQGSAEPLALYLNSGAGAFTLSSTSALGGHSGRIRQVAAGDVDGDGDLDLFAPDGAAGGDALFINDGNAQFTDESATRWPTTNSRAGAARFADVDGDGDLDLFVAEGYAQGQGASAALRLYLNDGEGSFSEASGQLPSGFQGEDADDIDVFDADRDFDLDVMVNMHSGNNNLWINDGAGNFSNASANLAPQRMGFHYNPAACDVDGDGDLDLWIDNMGPGYAEQLLINDGDGVFTDETSMRVSGNNGDDDNGVACADVDQDGDFDAVIWSLGATERVLLNDGAGNFTLQAQVFETVADPTLWGDLGDFDGDGRLDAATAQGEGNPDRNLVYRSSSDAVVDTRAPVVTHQQSAPATIAPDEALALRFALRDAVVSDGGARVRAFGQLRVDGSDSEIQAAFVGGDLYRIEVPGQAAGADVELSLCASDRAGNESCAEAQSWMVTDGGAESGAEGGEESGESGEASGESASGEAESGEAGADESSGDGNSSGCQCAADRPETLGTGLAWCVLFVLSGGAFRRRRNAA